MSYSKGAKMTRYIVTIGGSILFFFVSALQAPLLAQEEINVKREKDKTVYTIGSCGDNRREEAAERDKAWDMLKNMPVIIDGRQGQTRPPGPVSPPAQPSPVQPQPSK